MSFLPLNIGFYRPPVLFRHSGLMVPEAPHAVNRWLTVIRHARRRAGPRP
jgi:hypothetical protein